MRRSRADMVTPEQLTASFPGWRVFRSRGADGRKAGWYATRRRRPGSTLGAETGEGLAELLAGEEKGDEERWLIELPGTAASVPVLRRWVRAVLGTAGVAPSLELVASEYGTNALWHSASGLPGGRIRAELAVGREGVRISVQDDGPDPSSEVWDADRLDEHGRGLVLVEAYADRAGEYTTPEGRHVMWALLT
ncbi:ATP-binding protein [Actinomadura viridis]|uniref:ATP-binding protein n=1 Tax=Actinomadura viridis TaxID=58110 RepID=UPI00369835AB